MSQIGRIMPSGSDRPLVEAYDTALLDLDGVVYAGSAAIAHAVDSLDTARAGGMRLAYVTNNASRPPRVVAEHLTELGVPAVASDVINSAQAAARLVAEKVPAGAKVLVIGGVGLVEALAEHGLLAVESLADGPAAVVQGFDPSVGWAQLAEAAYAVASGLPWVASNTDLSIPTARGIAPGNGTLVAAVSAATGAHPEVAGKPLPPMHRETVLRTGARASAGGRGPPGHRHRGRVQRRRRLPAGLTGVTTPAQLLAAPVHPADLPGRRPARPADRTRVTREGGRVRVPRPDSARWSTGRLRSRGPATDRRAAGALRGGLDACRRRGVRAGRVEGAGTAGALSPRRVWLSAG